MNNDISMSQNFNSLILDNSPHMIWIKDINGKYLYINSNFCKYHNKKENDILNKTSLELFSNKDFDNINESDKTVLDSKSQAEFVFPFEDDYFECIKKPLFDGDNFIGILGTAIIITEFYKENIKLKKDMELLQLVFNNIPDVIFYKDTNSVYLGCNQNCADDVVISKNIRDVIGKTDLDLHPNKDMAMKFMERDASIMKNGIKEVSHVNINSKSLGDRYMENIKAPLISHDGTLLGIVGISRDMSYRKKLEDELYKLSYTDSLTNLYNRSCFAERSVELHKEKYLPLSIIMGDINGLKIINDSIGHLEGDQLILNISKIIQSCCRESDCIFRWGGDEIIILLPNTPAEKANEIISNIYKRCKNSQQLDIPLSISLGSSTITSLNVTVEDALKDAEAKVYRHKLLQSESFRSTLIDTLQRSLLEKSEETEQHTIRLQKYAVKIGEDLGLLPSEIDDLVLLCNLHDIGKIGVSEAILKKPSELTTEEFELMKLHCEKGYRITERIPELNHISKAILAHHERWDGTGYPLQLKGDTIPLISRIVSVVDAYDAMINDRIYRQAICKESALYEIKSHSGTQFDPDIVRSFLKIIK